MMLRSLFVAVGLTLATVGNAVTPSKVFDYRPYIEVMPGEVGYEGKSSYFLTTEDDCDLEIERIDATLNVIEKFNIPAATIMSKRTTLVPSLIYRTTYRGIGAYAASSTVDAIKLVQQYYPDGFVQLTMGLNYDQDPSSTPSILFIKGKNIPSGIYEGITSQQLYYWYTYEGHSDMEAFAIYSPGGGVVEFSQKTTYCSGEFDYDNIDAYMEYATEDMEYKSCVGCLTYTNFDELIDLDDIVASQTLFNSDKDYEVLIPVLSVSNQEVSDKREIYYNRIPVSYIDENGQECIAKCERVIYRYKKVVITGLAAINAKTGEKLTTFEFPEAFDYSSDMTARIYVIGNKKYLVAHDYDNYCYFYDLDEPSAIKAPVLTKKISVRPAIVNRGENVMVNVGDFDGISAITLTGINGQMEQRIAGNGGKTAAVNTGRLNSGVHIVGVTTADGESAYSKIVVK